MTAGVIGIKGEAKKQMDDKVKKTLKALEKHGFKTAYAKDRKEACKKILEMSEGCASVGVGGTATVRSTGVVEALGERGLDVFDHWVVKNPVDQLAVRKSQMTADLFLTGSNAVTMTGELVNMEGVGNRTNGMTFGPKKVIVVAGANKIVPDIQAGLERIEKIAGPKRAAELKMRTPCAKSGECSDCNVEERICRITVIHNRRPLLTDVTVMIVGEELGL